MDSSARTQLLQTLEARCLTISQDWYRAIAQTSYVPLPAAELRQRLADLVGEASELLVGEPFDVPSAEALGEALIRLHYLQPEALGRTLAVLGRQLVSDLPAAEVQALLPNLMALVEGVAVGFSRQGLRTVLREQEEVRSALLAELGKTETALRCAHDELEERVEQRTAQLASINEQLRIEIAERKRVEVALRRSQEGLQSVLSALHETFVVVFDRNLQHMHVWGPDELKRRYGLDYQDVIGRSVAALFPGAMADRLSADIRHVFETDESLRAEVVVNYPGGEFWHDVSLSPVRNELGEVSAVVAFVRDITERKRVEEALRESEARYRLLLETVRDGVYTLDTEGRFTFVNDVMVRRSGWSAEQLLGKPYLDFIRPEDRALARQNVEAVLRGETVPNQELAVSLASGDLLWVELNTTVLREGERIVGLHGVSRDITERRRAREALRESEQMWRSLAENAPDLVITADRERKIQFMNRLPPGSGLTVADVSGQDLLDYALPDHRAEVKAALARVLAQGSSEYLEAISTRAGSAPAWYATHVGPIRRDGEIAGLVLIARDVTERKRIEEVKDNLIRDVSHELRTPLAKTQMSLDYLQELVQRETIDPERIARVGQMARRNVQRLLHTVEGIMDLSALSASAPVTARESVSLAEIVDEVIREMEPLAAAQGLTLGADLPPALPALAGDADKIFRVLVNLIDNAIKFSERGEIVVRAWARGPEVVVSVSDSGPGIQPENLERIFERFFQEKSRVPGIGVGLTICKSIVEAHGGRIWAESGGRGQGATLYFTMSRAGG